MQNKKIKWILLIIVIAAAAVTFKIMAKGEKSNDEVTREISPSIGVIESIISTTGTVLPKNRLEVKPPVPGRIEEMLVKEGEAVKTGQTLAWMSSTERAALLDAARGQGEEALKYWKEAYKAIPLIAPIDGEIIVATTQPGQTVTTSDAIVVLSDRLISRAQVDETDIGNIKLGQAALITLDAYPDVKIKASVSHIYYESKTVNNVTIYEADLIPETTPPILRSGMNTTIDFVKNSKEDALLIPSEAVKKDKDGKYVMVKENGRKDFVRRAVETGLADDKNTEIVSGLTAADTVIIKTKKFLLPKSSAGTNPFMPARRQTRPQSQNSGR